MQFLKEGTAACVMIGMFVDFEDGYTPETGLTIAQGDLRLSKNGAAFAQKNDATAASSAEFGWYEVTLNTTDTGTAGRLLLSASSTGALPCWREFTVLTANVFDSLITGSGTDYLQTDAVSITASAISACTFTAGAVDAVAIAACALAETKFADGAINSDTFAAGAINAAAIGASAIAACTFAAGAVDSVAIAASAITTSEVATSAACAISDEVWTATTRAVTFAASAISACSFTAGAIDAVAIASGAIDADAIAASAIGTSELATGAADAIATEVWNEGTRTITGGTVGTLSASVISACTFTAGAIDGVAIAACAIDSATFAGSAINAAAFDSDALPLTAAQTQSSACDALVALNLDHLALTATGSADMTSEVADNTILSRMLSNGDTSAFVPSTDGLQLIRDAIAAAAPITFHPDASSVITTGSQNSGTYADTATDDGTYWEIGDENGTNTIDVICEFNMGTNRAATEIMVNGYYNRSGAGGYVTEIFAWNYTSGSWNKLSSQSPNLEMQDRSSDKNYTFALGVEHTDPLTVPGEVKINFRSTRGTTAGGDVLYLDHVSITGVSSGATSLEAYANAIWEHVIQGTATELSAGYYLRTLRALVTTVATGDTTTSFTLSDGLAVNDAYNGMVITVEDDTDDHYETRRITDWTSGLVMTVDRAFGFTPAAGDDAYIMATGYADVNVVATAASAISACTFATDAIDSVAIAACAIGTDAIAGSSLTSAVFAAGAINAAAVAACAIGITTIAGSAITAATFDAGAIDSAAIGTGAIDADAIAACAITNSEIADGLIVTSTFGSGAINAAAIAASAITTSELATSAADAVATEVWNAGTRTITGGSVSTLSASVITACSFDAGAIDSVAVATGAIDADAIAASAITTSELATSAANDIATEVWNEATRTITGGTVSALSASVITACSFDAGAIDSVAVASGAIDADAIAASAIGTSELATSAADAIATEVWNAGTRTITGTVSVATLAASSISACTFDAGAIDAAAIADSAIDAGAIAASAIGTSELATSAADAVATEVWNAGTRTITGGTIGTLSASVITACTFGAGAIDNVAIAASAIAADVNAEMVDVITGDTIADLSVTTPPATPALSQGVMYLYSALRNQIDASSGCKEFYNNAGSAIWNKAVSETGSVYSEAEGT